MTVRVGREELLRCLESVQPGLAPNKETIQQSGCFVFSDGWLVTFNDEVACRTPSPLGKKFEGAVRCKKLLDLLGKLTEKEVYVELDGGQLVMSCRQEWKGKLIPTRKAGLAMESEILLPVGSIEVPDEWKPLHKDFCDAVAVVAECAKTSGKAKFQHTAVHCHPEWLEACDQYQLCRWPMDTGLAEAALLRKESVKHITSLAMTEFAETPGWVHFRNAAGLELACRRFVEPYGEYTKYLEDVQGSPTNLPKGFVEEAALGQLFSSEHGQGNDRVLVEVRPGRSRLVAKGITGWYEGPWRKITYDGGAFSFLISPGMLASIAEKHNECLLSEGRLTVRGNGYTYMAYLLAPGGENGPAPVTVPAEDEEQGDEQGSDE